MDALAYAVATAETGNCTKGAGVSKNNCFGIMRWNNGNRYLAAFDSPEESYEAFKELWKRGYDAYPNRAIAMKYTGNDNPDTWLRNVNSSYISYTKAL